MSTECAGHDAARSCAARRTRCRSASDAERAARVRGPGRARDAPRTAPLFQARAADAGRIGMAAVERGEVGREVPGGWGEEEADEDDVAASRAAVSHVLERYDEQVTHRMQQSKQHTGELLEELLHQLELLSRSRSRTAPFDSHANQCLDLAVFPTVYTPHVPHTKTVLALDPLPPALIPTLCAPSTSDERRPLVTPSEDRRPRGRTQACRRGRVRVGVVGRAQKRWVGSVRVGGAGSSRGEPGGDEGREGGSRERVRRGVEREGW